MSKKVKKEGNLAGTFFAALMAGGGEEALGVLRDAAIDKAGAPTPRTKEYIEKGEWDAKDRLGILYARPGTCFGRVGVAAQQPGGVARFCGRSRCPTASHKKATVDVAEGQWFIQAGIRSPTGFLSEPTLPSWRDGGPIPGELESKVDEMGLLPILRLTLGQWKFLFEDWHNPGSVPEAAMALEEIVLQAPPGAAETDTEIGIDASEDAKPEATSDLKADDTFWEKIKFSKVTASGSDTYGSAESMTPDVSSAESADEIKALQNTVVQLISRISAIQDDARMKERKIQLLERQLIKTRGDVSNMDANLVDLQGRIAAHEALLKSNQQNEISLDEKATLERVRHEVLDSSGAMARIEHDLATVATRMESGGGIDFHGYAFGSDQDTLEWYDSRNGHVALFADAMALLHAINATVVHTPESTRSKEAAKKIDLASELEASIIASFSTTLPSILVGNQKDTQGGAYECLIGYLKTYTVWNPLGPNGTSGLKHRIRDGTRSVSGRLRTLQSVLTTNHDLKEVAMYIISDSLSFIVELSEFVGQQYEELCTTSSFTKEAAWSLIIDCMAHIFVELSEVRSAVVDAGQMKQGLFLWGLLRAWEVQERYRNNQFKNDPALTGLLVRRILVHDGEQNLKEQLEAVATHETKLKDLSSKIDSEHKEAVAFQKKVKAAVPALK